MAEPEVSIPSKNPFAPKIVEVTGPSGRKYTMRELSAFEQMQADSAAITPAEALYYRMGVAIVTIDDETITPRPTKDFVSVLLRKISGPDAEALVMAYTKEFTPQLQDTEVKNSPTPFV
jgi:hypothetical protein